MTLQNSFDKTELIRYFDRISCWGCGKNNPVDFHHILGRAGTDTKEGYTHSSKLNAAPLCRKCHTPEWRTAQGEKPLHHAEVVVDFLSQTLSLVRLNKAPLTAKDHDFMRKHKQLYKLVEDDLTKGLYPERASKGVQQDETIGHSGKSSFMEGLPGRMFEDT